MCQYQKFTDTKMIILATHPDNPKSTWGSLTRMCKVLNLPYHSLKSKSYPFEWQDWRFEKIPFNGA